MNGNGSIPTWVNIRVKLGDLKPWALNPRHITKKQAERLATSFDSFGQVETVAVSPSLDVYNGHQRLSVLHKLHGPNYEIDARQASRPLTDDERRKLVIYLHAGAVGGWDWDSLSSWPAETLIQNGFDGDLLGDWKKDIAALGNLLESETPEPKDAEPQIDRAEELNKKWQVKTGDLWRIGEHRLLCGDSTRREDVERVMQGKRAGAVVTDSPYGIERDGIVNDDPEGLRALFDGVLVNMPIENAVIINFQSPRLFPVWLDAVRAAGHKFERMIWMYKPNDETFPWRGWLQKSEAILISSKGNGEWLRVDPFAHDCYSPTTLGSELPKSWGKAHASVKPLVVVQDLVSRIGGDVYEPFDGSGTTIVACQNLHRKCRAIEISPAYCAVTLERMATAFPGIEIERLESSNASHETCNEQATN